jgi:hypothetical protein
VIVWRIRSEFQDLNPLPEAFAASFRAAGTEGIIRCHQLMRFRGHSAKRPYCGRGRSPSRALSEFEQPGDRPSVNRVSKTRRFRDVPFEGWFCGFHSDPNTSRNSLRLAFRDSHNENQITENSSDRRFSGLRPNGFQAGTRVPRSRRGIDRRRRKVNVPKPPLTALLKVNRRSQKRVLDKTGTTAAYEESRVTQVHSVVALASFGYFEAERGGFEPPVPISRDTAFPAGAQDADDRAIEMQ